MLISNNAMDCNLHLFWNCKLEISLTLSLLFIQKNIQLLSLDLSIWKALNKLIDSLFAIWHQHNQHFMFMHQLIQYQGLLWCWSFEIARGAKWSEFAMIKETCLLNYLIHRLCEAALFSKCIVDKNGQTILNHKNYKELFQVIKSFLNNLYCSCWSDLHQIVIKPVFYKLITATVVTFCNVIDQNLQ